MIITGIGAAVGVTAISTGLANRRSLLASLITVAIWAAVYYPLQYLFFYVAEGWMLVLLGIAAIGIGIGAETVFHIATMIVGALIIFFLIVEPHGLARLWSLGKEKLRVWPFPYG